MKVEYVMEHVPLDQVQQPIVRDGIAYWQSLRRGRAFPARADVAPSGMKKLLPNALLVRVIEGGKDYEYRIAGEAHTSVHGVPLQGRKLSELNLERDYRDFIGSLYDEAFRTRAPYAMKGAVRSGNDYPSHFKSESAFLPLGPDDTTVDHILVFSVYAPTDRLEV